MRTLSIDTDMRRGFSLPELLTALLIISIVASFAIPSWKGYLQSARRTAAVALLMQTAAKQEQFRSEHQRYADNNELKLSPPAGLGATATSDGYKLSTVSTASTFTLTATAARDGVQADDLRCRAFSVDETGRYWSVDANGTITTPACWRK